MARKRTTKAEVAIDNATPEEVGFDPTVLGEMGGTVLDEMEAAVAGAGAEDAPGDDAPVPTDPGWNEYVLGHFLPEEKDHEGSPTVDGLRRVAELLLGPIVAVRPEIVQAPSAASPNSATAVVHVSFAWSGETHDIRVFGDAADVSEGNTDPAYARFAAAMAVTRAEGRAYRKALKLRKVVASAEKTTVPVEDGVSYEVMTGHQVASFDKTCRDLDINAAAIIKGSKATRGFKSVKLIPREAASQLLGGLNGFIQNPDTIPPAFAGYDPNWRNS